MINLERYERMVLEHSSLQGEKPFTAFYWEEYLTGGGEEIWPEHGDEYSDSWTIFEVTFDEAEAFDLCHGDTVAVWSDAQGFQYGRAFASRELAQMACNDYYGGYDASTDL